MANGKQKYLTKGTNEYLAGIEFDVTKQPDPQLWWTDH